MIKAIQYITIIKLAGIHFVIVNLLGCLVELHLLNPVANINTAPYFRQIFVGIIYYICVVPLSPMQHISEQLIVIPFMDLLCPLMESFIWGLTMYVIFCRLIIVKGIINVGRQRHE